MLAVLGGPGGSGLEAIEGFAQSLVNITGGHYDMVTWDPRGVGFSSWVDSSADRDVPSYLSFTPSVLETSSASTLSRPTKRSSMALFKSMASR